MLHSFSYNSCTISRKEIITHVHTIERRLSATLQTGMKTYHEWRHDRHDTNTCSTTHGEGGKKKCTGHQLHNMTLFSMIKVITEFKQ